jgi:hypothetical protein
MERDVLISLANSRVCLLEALRVIEPHPMDRGYIQGRCARAIETIQVLFLNKELPAELPAEYTTRIREVIPQERAGRFKELFGKMMTEKYDPNPAEQDLIRVFIKDAVAAIRENMFPESKAS